MNEMNFDWDDLRLFLAVARAKGLAPAAEATGKSAPTLGRRMLALERRLGRELFVRLPRGYALTDDGQAFLTKAEALEHQVVPLITQSTDAGGPVVKISAGLWVTHLLCGHVAQIVGRTPVRLRFIANDAADDIGRRAALIGIRNRRPEGPGMAGQRVASVQFAIYARDPAITTWAQVVGQTPSAKWVQEASGNAPKIEVTSPRNALDLALGGSAKLVLPTFVARMVPDLQAVSDPIAELEHDQWLVTHHEDRFLPDVRGVIDRIAKVLRAAGQGT